MLSLVAAALYGAVVLSCLAALATALIKRQIPAHWRSWGMLAVLFTVLAVLRVLNLEEIWRDELRDLLLATDSYDDRRGFQGIVVLVIAGLVGAAGFFWIFRKARGARGRRNFTVIAAQAAGMAMAALIAVRIVSFSAIDRLLFGPLKLNWVMDIGASVLVAGCAAYYIWVVAQGAAIKPRDARR